MAGGIQRKGNSYFELTEKCTKYRYCICRCNGSWNCPDRFAQNTCKPGTDTGKSSGGKSVVSTTPKTIVITQPSKQNCKPCNYNGWAYPNNKVLTINGTDCSLYGDCTCSCDGSWVCAAGASERCRIERDRFRHDVSRCKSCSVSGQSFKGNSYFSVRDGCIEYSNCICRCNGSWSCPGTGAKNICGKGPYVTMIPAVYTGNQKGRCLTCKVTNKVFQGNSFFNVTDQCIQYQRCFCSCDGSWNCPSQYAKNICLDKGNGNCKTCNAKGKIVTGGTKFDLIVKCISYSDCECRCDGSWNCPSQYAKNICLDKGNGNCKTCNAKGKIVTGGTKFDLIDKCISYSDCECRCDGSWECPSQYAKNICLDKGNGNCKTCNAKGKIVSGGTKFDLIDTCISYSDCECRCDGSWECFGDKAIDRCRVNSTRWSGCTTCKAIDGSVHHPNRPFTIMKECIEYNCDCHCNGSWNCPAERSRWACTHKCLGCDVEGRKVASNTTFTHKTGCLEYTCDCHCNGSWSCPGRTVRNTCPTGVNVNCNRCEVSPREQYEGETDFVLRRDCLHYKCRCNCDGSYSCPGKDARNVCRGERLGGCRSCVVSEREVYRGNIDFNFRKGCISYQCRCNCDGSWSCPAKDARDVCVGEVPGGCRVCRVSDTEIYRANTQFDLRKGCIHYKCQCNCDGGWKCPGKDARDVCKGEVPGGCRSCVVYENKFYPGNSHFEMVKNCIHYKCRCHCNGGYNCPGETAKRVCKPKDEDLPPLCRECVVSDNEKFQGNSSFSIERGCNKYQCKCKCDGSWECPASKTEDICKQTRRISTKPVVKYCKPCKIGKDIVPGNSRFKFNRRCFQVDCRCNCTGEWSCDHLNPINMCELRRRLKVKPSIISGANVVERADLSSENRTYISEKGASFVEIDISSNSGVNTSETDGNHTIFTDQENVDFNATYYNSSSVFIFQGYEGNNDTNTTEFGTGEEGNVTDSLDSIIDQAFNIMNNLTGTTVNVSDGGVVYKKNCNKCFVANGFTREVNEVFSYRTKCMYYNQCVCLCSGKWQCYGSIETCRNSRDRKLTSTSSTSVSSTSSTRDEHVIPFSGSSSSTHGGQRHSLSGRKQTEEVITRTKVELGGKDRKQVQRVKGGSGSDYEITIDVDYSSTGRVEGRKGGTVRHIGSVDQLYKGSSSSSSSSSSYHGASSSSGSSSSSSSASSSSFTTGGCRRCIVDDKEYGTGAKFDWRRGCVLYKCTCDCSGSYRCRVTSDNICKDSQSRNRCGNCVYRGMVYPGNMAFSVTEGCYEKICECFCNGTYECKNPSYVPGCSAGSSHRGTYRPSGSVYRVNQDGGYLSRGHLSGTNVGSKHTITRGTQVQHGGSIYRGHVSGTNVGSNYTITRGTQVQHGGSVYRGHVSGTNVGSRHNFTSGAQVQHGGSVYRGHVSGTNVGSRHNFTSGTQVQHGGSVSGGHVSGTNSGGGSVSGGHFSNTNFGARHTVTGGANVQHGGSRNQNLGTNSGTRYTVTTVTNSTISGQTDRCRGCTIEGQQKSGNSSFTFRKGCIDFDCFCACGGSWKCSSKQSQLCGRVGNRTSTHRCRNCLVQGTTYPHNSKFSLREGCSEYMCSCKCDGSWSCPSQRPKYICSGAEQGSGHDISKSTGVLYKVVTRPNGNDGQDRWSGHSHERTCRECTLDGQVFIPEKDFQFLRGRCYLYNCHCHCNGSYNCPPENTKNICKDNKVIHNNERGVSVQAGRPMVEVDESGEPVRNGDIPGCQRCSLNGQTVEPLGMFIKQGGCFETLCHCQCNGETSCPESASVNVCELPDKKPMGERPGCKVGRRKHFTRVFGMVQDCYQRICICHDNGTWTCRRSANDKKVC